MDWADCPEIGGRELRIEEVQGMSRKPFWVWVEGMYLGGSDDFIALRFLNGFPYEPVSREIWRRLSYGAQLVIDVGAHSGTFTLDAYRSGVERVLSVEPHPFNFSRLVLNLRHGGFPVSGAVYAAAGDEDKISHLLVKQLYQCHSAGRMDLHNKNGMELPVRLSKLDTLIPEEIRSKVKVAKIDAENFTPKVLLGMKGILEHRPDLILEVTTGGMDEILKPYGYQFWMIDERGSVTPVETLTPFNPDNTYNGTDEDHKNRFCSVKGLP